MLLLCGHFDIAIYRSGYPYADKLANDKLANDVMHEATGSPFTND